MIALREHQLVVWSQHGVMTRSDNSISRALDLIEYAETAAHYECLNIFGGDLRPGFSPETIRTIAESVKIQQNIF